MTQEKKQTAVEWLIHELRLEGFIENGDDLILIEHKALAMEREQIEEAFDAARFLRTKAWDGEDYFAKTYGKEVTDANG